MRSERRTVARRAAIGLMVVALFSIQASASRPSQVLGELSAAICCEGRCDRSAGMSEAARCCGIDVAPPEASNRLFESLLTPIVAMGSLRIPVSVGAGSASPSRALGLLHARFRSIFILTKSLLL